jgi:hypothetical protein
MTLEDLTDMKIGITGEIFPGREYFFPSPAFFHMSRIQEYNPFLPVRKVNTPDETILQISGAWRDEKDPDYRALLYLTHLLVTTDRRDRYQIAVINYIVLKLAGHM